MSKYLVHILFLAVFLTASCSSTSTVVPVDEIVNPSTEVVYPEDEALQSKIAEIGAEAKGDLGVFALLMEEDRAVSFGGRERFAMQSVVKLPVAMLVMHQVSEGKFTLDQKIKFTTDDLVNPNQRSPLRDKNPNGGEATVDELIRLAIVESDGTACDVLTRISGGPSAVQSYIASLAISGMEVKWTHKEFGRDWDLQYENQVTPEAAVELLESLWGQKGEAAEGSEQKELLLLKYMSESIRERIG